MNLTRLRETEAVDSFREVVHANILGFGAILEELLHNEMGISYNRGSTFNILYIFLRHELRY